MRKAMTTIAAIATLVLVVKVVVASSKTTADAETMKNPIQNAMSIYDLHAGYPNMKTLATERTPQP